MRKRIITIFIGLSVLLFTVGCEDHLSENAKDYAREEAEKAYDKAWDKAEKKYEELAEQNQKMIDSLKADNNELRGKMDGYEGERRKWWHYIKLGLYLLGLFVAVRLFGKPVARIVSYVFLKRRRPPSRRVVNIQRKHGSAYD